MKAAEIRARLALLAEDLGAMAGELEDISRALGRRRDPPQGPPPMPDIHLWIKGPRPTDEELARIRDGLFGEIDGLHKAMR